MISFLICLAAGLLATRAAQAQITVSPMSIDLDKPAKRLPKIKVTNGSGERHTFEVSVAAAAHDENGAAIEAPKAYRYSADKMLTPRKRTFTLDAGQSTDVEVDFDIPKGRTGSVHALVWILGMPDSAKTALTFASYLRMGVSVSIVLANGPVAFRMGKIGAGQDSYGAITFLVPVENTGGQCFNAGGTLRVKDGAGKEIANLPLEIAPVYPGMVRHVKATWTGKRGPRALAKGDYQLVADVKVAGATKQKFGAFTMLAGALAQEQGTVVKMPLRAAVKGQAIPLEATVAIQGKTPFAGSGRVTFYKPGTRDQVGQVVLSTSAPVAAGTRGTLTGRLDRGLPPGSYTARLELLDKNDFVIAVWSGNQEVADLEVEVAGSIKQLTAPTGGERIVTVEFQNDSNVPVEAEGAVLIVDAGGAIVGTVALPKQKVAAGKTCLYQDRLPALEPGRYELRAAVQFAGQKAARSQQMTEGLAADADPGLEDQIAASQPRLTASLMP